MLVVSPDTLRATLLSKNRVATKSPLFHISIIVVIKLIALTTLWYCFFSQPISHNMTVKTEHMAHHLLAAPAHQKAAKNLFSPLFHHLELILRHE